jgi:cytochrome P450
MANLEEASFSADGIDAIARQFHVTNLNVMEPDPYPAMAALREHCPVFRSELHGGYYVVTRHADQRAILRDPTHFSSRQVMIPPLAGGGFGPPTESDEPAHALYRRALDGYFTMARMNEKHDELRSRAQDLLTSLVANGGGDLIQEYCRPLPTLTFVLLAGLPVEDLPKLQAWMHQLLGVGGEPDREHNEQVVAPAIHQYFRELLERREAMSDPPNDVLTGIVNASLGDEPWSRQDQVFCIMQLVMAGMETVTSTLGLTLLFLAENPSHRMQLVDDPALIPDAVEEFLRYFTIETTARTVVSDVEVAGTTFHEGELVLLPLVSSGRDALAFPDPDVVDFSRRPSQHLAFGMGPHRCMGSHVARTELRIALEEVIRLMPNFTLAPNASPTHRWGTVFGLDDLEVVIERA